jgi:hypothetical protein
MPGKSAEIVQDHLFVRFAPHPAVFHMERQLSSFPYAKLRQTANFCSYPIPSHLNVTTIASVSRTKYTPPAPNRPNRPNRAAQLS